MVKKKFSIIAERRKSLDSDGVRVPGLKLSLAEDLYCTVAHPQYSNLFHFAVLLYIKL